MNDLEREYLIPDAAQIGSVGLSMLNRWIRNGFVRPVSVGAGRGRGADRYLSGVQVFGIGAANALREHGACQQTIEAVLQLFESMTADELMGHLTEDRYILVAGPDQARCCDPHDVKRAIEAHPEALRFISMANMLPWMKNMGLRIRAMEETKRATAKA